MKQRNSARILNLLKSSGRASAQYVAKQLGMSEVGARQHLMRLLHQGLVEFQDQAGAVGRPKRAWMISDQGQNGYPDRHADLALEMLRATREAFGNFGTEGIIAAREAEILERYRSELAGLASLRSRIEKLAEIRTEEGYLAQVLETGEAVFLLSEAHCPIRAAASQCQALCRSELDIFRKALGENIDIERTEHVLAGDRRCAYQVTQKSTAQA